MGMLPLIRLLLDPRSDRRKFRAELLGAGPDEPERYYYECFGWFTLGLAGMLLGLALAVAVGVTGNAAVARTIDALWIVFIGPVLAVALLRWVRGAQMARTQGPRGHHRGRRR